MGVKKIIIRDCRYDDDDDNGDDDDDTTAGKTAMALLCKGHNSAPTPHGSSSRIVAPVSTDFFVHGFDDSLPARKPVITGLQKRGFGNVSGGRERGPEAGGRGWGTGGGGGGGSNCRLDVQTFYSEKAGYVQARRHNANLFSSLLFIYSLELLSRSKTVCGSSFEP